jgi:hypothetical protein
LRRKGKCPPSRITILLPPVNREHLLQTVAKPPAATPCCDVDCGGISARRILRLQPKSASSPFPPVRRLVWESLLRLVSARLTANNFTRLDAQTRRSRTSVESQANDPQRRGLRLKRVVDPFGILLAVTLKTLALEGTHSAFHGREWLRRPSRPVPPAAAPERGGVRPARGRPRAPPPHRRNRRAPPRARTIRATSRRPSPPSKGTRPPRAAARRSARACPIAPRPTPRARAATRNSRPGR